MREDAVVAFLRFRLGKQPEEQEHITVCHMLISQMALRRSSLPQPAHAICEHGIIMARALRVQPPARDRLNQRA